MLSEQEYEQFIHLMESGATNRELRTYMKYSESRACREILFYRIHGKKAFYEYYVKNVKPKYTKDELRSIAEYLYLNNIAVDRGAIIFKASRGHLYDLIAERRQTGKPLAEPATLPELHGTEGREFSRAQNSDEEASEPRLKGDSFIVKSFALPEASSPPVAPPEHELPRIGKARAPVSTGRVPKKMRNRELMEQNKEQAALKARTSDTKECDPIKTPCYQTLGDLANDIIGPFPKGIPAKEWSRKKHHQYDIDIESEGFKELPPEVQCKAYELHFKKCAVREAALKKLYALVQGKHSV